MQWLKADKHYTCPISLFHRTYLAGQTCRQLPPCKTKENKSRATSHTFPLAMLCASGRAWQAPGEQAVDQFLMATLGGCSPTGPGAGRSASTRHYGYSCTLEGCKVLYKHRADSRLAERPRRRYPPPRGPGGQIRLAAPLPAVPHLGPARWQQLKTTALHPPVLDAERGAVAAPRHRIPEAQLGRVNAHPGHVPPPARHGRHRLTRPASAAWKQSLSNGRRTLIGSKKAALPNSPIERGEAGQRRGRGGERAGQRRGERFSAGRGAGGVWVSPSALCRCPKEGKFTSKLGLSSWSLLVVPLGVQPEPALLHPPHTAAGAGAGSPGGQTSRGRWRVTRLGRRWKEIKTPISLVWVYQLRDTSANALPWACPTWSLLFTWGVFLLQVPL